MNRRRSTACRAGLMAAGVALVLTACGGGSGGSGGGSSEPAAEQVLTFGLSGDVPSLQPHLDQGAAAMLLDTALHRGLLAYDENAEVVPALAESWEHTDHTVFTFTLRDGLTFHDGSPLTSEEVRRSFEEMADPDSAAKIVAATQEIADIETPDEQTVVITLEGQNVAFPEYIADTTAAILPPEAYENDGESWVGAGPFELIATDRGVSFSLEKFDGYYEADAVSLDGIEFQVYTDDQARANALFAGDVDMIDFVPWQEFDRVEADPDLQLQAESGPFMYLNFNVEDDDSPFADPRVRQAVALAVNRDSVISAALAGHGFPIEGTPIPEASPFYSADLATAWAQDVARAQQLMDEAGYADGFTAAMLSSSQYSFHQDTALAVQNDLAAIGITLEMDLPDWATRVSRGNAGEYEIAVSGSAGVVNDPSFLAKFVQGPAEHTRSFGYDNAELNEKLAQALAISDEAERAAAYEEISQIIIDDVPFASLAGRAQAFGSSGNVEGFTNLPGFLTFNSGYTLVTTQLTE